MKITEIKTFYSYLYLENFPTSSAGWSLSISGRGFGFLISRLKQRFGVRYLSFNRKYKLGKARQILIIEQFILFTNLYSSTNLSQRISTQTIVMKPSPTMRQTPTTIPNCSNALMVCSPEIFQRVTQPEINWERKFHWGGIQSRTECCQIVVFFLSIFPPCFVSLPLI